MTVRNVSPWEAVITDWLLDNAVWDRDKAREEWETEGMTLLKCGGTFCAIRIPVPLVEAVAPRSDPDSVDAHLAQALDRAPAFRCNTGQWYYVLVPPTVASWWDKRRGGECIGAGLDLGVPSPRLIGHPGRTASYWAVTMTRPGHLGSGETVSQFIADAHLRAVQEGVS